MPITAGRRCGCRANSVPASSPQDVSSGVRAGRGRLLALLPHCLTGLRLASAPLLWWLIVDFRSGPALLCVGFAMVSDVLDGWLARRFGSPSRLGAYFDTVTDFLVIMAGYSAFAHLGVYPAWLVGLIALAFLVFLLSSRLTQAIYDPVGRHIGAVLFVAIATTLLFQDLMIQGVILAIAATSLAVTLVWRVVFATLAIVRPVGASDD